MSNCIEIGHSHNFFTLGIKSIMALSIAMLIDSYTLLSQTKVEQITEIMKERSSTNDFNGNILVSHNNEVILSQSYGKFDFKTEKSLEPNDCFYLASISKQFTAVLTMQLVQESQLTLESSITDYLTDYRNDVGDKIMIHNLLCHSSGLQEFYAEDEFGEGVGFINEMSESELFMRCQKEPLFHPGGGYKYSDTNYILLSLIIEKVMGKSLRYYSMNAFSYR